LYTGENNATQLECGHGTGLGMKVLDMMLSTLSCDLISNDLVNPLSSCLPIFMDQAVRSNLLKDMPKLDDIDVIVQQIRDASQGVKIPKIDDADGQRGMGPTSGSGKGKENAVASGSTPKAASQSPPGDIGASIRPTASSEKKRRLVHSDRSSVSKPVSKGQQASSMATAKQMRGSDSGGPGAVQAGTKGVAAPTSDLRAAAKKSVMATGSSGSDGGGSRAARASTKEAITPTSDPKAAAKRTVVATRSSGSNPPRKRFHVTWTDKRLGPDLLRGSGKSIGGDLDIDNEGFE
jgi:hypothetical protein